jgi:hypothetical protein
LVERLLIEGTSVSNVVEIVQRVHTACERVIREDCILIRKRWKEEASKGLEELRGQAAARLYEDRRRYAKEGAWTAHAAATRELHRVQRITIPDQHGVTVQVASAGPTQVNVNYEDALHEARILLAHEEEQKLLGPGQDSGNENGGGEGGTPPPTTT